MIPLVEMQKTAIFIIDKRTHLQFSLRSLIHKTEKRQREILFSNIGKNRSRTAVLRSGGLSIRLSYLCKSNIIDIECPVKVSSDTSKTVF